ncbi:transcription factor Hsf1 [Coprinopsis cinerea okayama7|uniref:Transcription factor Hsf1 n=1 Tax=Coprinopsis cinerea (strain Okayama-7 / 130 / ATCC MYA-4618 / FGSC 9003) TaxID=240176 RepID=A8PGG2_COPC7|nr:transcription factor Hsf1 [Coprinopsis cinerea okayama7\|eukprot:XP_001841211.1 transcription factor Hsf1 [Coprinopsis cinerea okayama7\
MATDSQMTVARAGKSLPPAPLSKATRQVVPAFLQKLYEMVNDPKNSDLIRWSDTGDSFFVLDHERFAHDVLGRWFKHRNFSSFVRQLNMYGFHKIPHLQQGVLKSDNETEFWNFAHPNFHRGQPDLLCLIQRKKASSQQVNNDDIDLRDSTPTANGQVLDIQSVINGITAIKRHQTTISAELNELKRSNQLLWQDAMAARQRYQKQQDTINRIVKFLAGVFGSTVNRTKDGSPEPHVVIPRRAARFLIEDAKREGKGIVELDDLYAPEDMATPISITSVESDNHVETTPVPQPAPVQPEPEPKPTDRAVTPRQPSPSYDFDPRVHGMLSQLTQSQIQTLLNTLASQPLGDANTASSNPTSSTHLTPYQPPPFDFSMIPSTPGTSNESHVPVVSPPAAPPTEGLISFNSFDGFPTERMERQWQQAEDIDRDVNALNTSIHSLIQTFGLDPNMFDSMDTSTDPTNPTNPAAPNPSVSIDHNAHPPTAPNVSAPSADTMAGPSGALSNDLGPVPPADFDFDAFLNTLPSASANDGMDYTDAASTAFLDEVPSPASTTTSPVQNLRGLSPEISTNGGSGLAVPQPVIPTANAGTKPPTASPGLGRKRKSDVSELDGGALAMQFQTVTPSAILPGVTGSPHLHSASLSTNAANSKSKRRKEK